MRSSTHHDGTDLWPVSKTRPLSFPIVLNNPYRPAVISICNVNVRAKSQSHQFETDDLVSVYGKDAFVLRVENRNSDTAGTVVTLHWSDGVLLPPADFGDNEKNKPSERNATEQLKSLQAEANDDVVQRGTSIPVEHGTD